MPGQALTMARERLRGGADDVLGPQAFTWCTDSALPALQHRARAGEREPDLAENHKARGVASLQAMLPRCLRGG